MPGPDSRSKPRLFLLFGDQLSPGLVAAARPGIDRILLAETRIETTHVRHHQHRLVLFLSAMRHFAASLRERGHDVDYFTLDHELASHDDAVERALSRRDVESIELCWPGDQRLLDMAIGWEKRFGIPVNLHEDPRFFCTREQFSRWADGRKQFLLEDFYRWMRKRTGLLMEDGKPVTGQWNYDKDNRKSLDRDIDIPAPYRATQDGITCEVIALVRERFPSHPGDAGNFHYAVTREQALRALDRFIEKLLPSFGDYQDAMKRGEQVLFHSVLSPYLNIGLLEPRETCERAIAAYEKGAAPINAVEGFLRQVLGWREFVRGIYWHFMPDYAQRNSLDARREIPPLMWNGETDMECLRQSIGQLQEHAYAHHIQRLMVIGLFAMQYGVDPRAFHDWHMAMYIDAVDWVSLPNALGMSQHADGGIVGSKPYCASGAYIQRMSDYCANCRYSPKQATGEKACPMTTLYWDFLDRHADRFAGNRRMVFQLRNLERKSAEEREAIREAADALRRRLGKGTA